MPQRETSADEVGIFLILYGLNSHPMRFNEILASTIQVMAASMVVAFRCDSLELHGKGQEAFSAAIHVKILSS